MRIIVITAVGWVAGGLLVIALDRAPARADAPEVLTVERRPGARVVVPVAGVTARELRDTFTEARGSGRVHNAIDILAPRGTPVIAAVDGTIRKLFTSRAGGLTIYQFDPSGSYVYYYAHLDRYRDGLTEKQAVRRGEVIGYVGSTGNAQTPHLHFAIEKLPPSREWWKGSAINPYPVLMGR